LADSNVFVLAEWSREKAGDDWYVVERQPGGSAVAVTYGPMLEDQTSPFIAERRAVYDELAKKLTKRQY